MYVSQVAQQFLVKRCGCQCRILSNIGYKSAATGVPQGCRFAIKLVPLISGGCGQYLVRARTKQGEPGCSARALEFDDRIVPGLDVPDSDRAVDRGGHE